MSLMDRLLRRFDPAHSWGPRPGLRLVADLAEASFCGIRIGDPIQALSRLGRPQNHRPTRDGTYAYFDDGFELGGEATLDSICLYWGTPDRPEYRPFGGRLLLRGSPLDVGPATRESAFVARFGPPYWKDVDPDETLLFYERGPIEWQVEFHPAGGLKALLIVTPPLLADEAQRQAFGVTRSWPPS
jgi:hypothetical protein